jgi:WD40 repeat protein
MACGALAFSPDGHMLATASVDGTVSIFDAASGQEKGTLGRHAIPAGCAVFSADGKRLASAGVSINPWGADADLKVWDLATRRESSTPIGRSFINAVGFASSRPIFVSAGDKTISVWEA